MIPCVIAFGYCVCGGLRIWLLILVGVLRCRCSLCVCCTLVEVVGLTYPDLPKAMRLHLSDQLAWSCKLNPLLLLGGLCGAVMRWVSCCVVLLLCFSDGVGSCRVVKIVQYIYIYIYIYIYTSNNICSTLVHVAFLTPRNRRLSSRPRNYQNTDGFSRGAGTRPQPPPTVRPEC